MTFEARGSAGGPLDAATRLTKELAKIRRALRCAETFLERALDQVDRTADDLESGAASGLPGVGRRQPPLARVPLPVATRIVQVSSARVAFVVHGVEYQIDLSPVRIALICALIAAADDRSDALVGFKSITSLVQALRARGWAATRRSVTVEVSRLRAALGPANGLLIETRRGAGYRFRMLRAGVPAGCRA
jgi:hypothetical protein